MSGRHGNYHIPTLEHSISYSMASLFVRDNLYMTMKFPQPVLDSYIVYTVGELQDQLSVELYLLF